MIKVRNTEIINDTLVAKGKLILIECDYKEANLFWCDTLGFSIYNSSMGKVKTIGKYLEPIIISEIEEIKSGDNIIVNEVINGTIKIYGSIKKAESNFAISPYVQKILALPENFSEELLQEITEGKYKDNDEVFIQCDQKELGWSGIWENFINLYNNNHIIIVEEDKLITNFKNMLSKYSEEELEQIVKFWEDYKKKNPEAYRAIAEDKDHSNDN